jgi:putative transposase
MPTRWRIGSRFTHDGVSYRATNFPDLETVVAIPIHGGHPVTIRRDTIDASSPAPSPIPLNDRPLERQAELLQKLERVQAILNTPPQSRERRDAIREHAHRTGRHPATVYEWVRQFEQGGANALLRVTRYDNGRHRLEPKVEAILQDAIHTRFLTRQRHSMTRTLDDIRRQCLASGLPTPSMTTLRRRVQAQFTEREVLEARHGKSLTASYKPSVAPARCGTAPHDLVQIDHHRLDLELVDDTTRRSCGRPWLTTAFDTKSRVALGFHLSFDAPSTISVALCLVHAVSAKEPWLAARGIVGRWPCAGLFERVQVDNAREFRSPRFVLACAQYGILVEYRRVRRPHDGPHIERFHRTLESTIHALPGTTFSSPADRGSYPSEARACMTRQELEAWLGEFIVGVYQVDGKDSGEIGGIREHPMSLEGIQ